MAVKMWRSLYPVTRHTTCVRVGSAASLFLRIIQANMRWMHEVRAHASLLEYRGRDGPRVSFNSISIPLSRGVPRIA
jgi:hypothetical protein